MTLAELFSSPMPSPAELRLLCVVFPTALAQRMVNVHSWYGDPRCTVFPALLADGRWVVPAAMLSDCVTPGGTYFAGFSRLDRGKFGQVEVLPVSAVTMAEQQETLAPESPSPVS
jgi:hypothetical protein